MAKCNGNHNMVDGSKDSGNCEEDSQTGQKQRKITVHTRCSNEDCSATGVYFYWESC